MVEHGVRWVAVAVLIVGSAGCSRDRSEAPPPTPARDAGAAPAPPLAAPPAIREGGVTTVEVSAADGALVRTPDGAALHLDAGALSRDATVRITRRLVEPAEERVTLYDVDLGGATLTRAVTLDLPIEHPGEVTTAEEVRISQLDGKKGWQALPGTLSADRSTITVHPRHFSIVRKEEPTTWAQYWFRADRRSPKILDVPYYSQDDYSWCWAASLAMVESAHGRPTKPWEVAGEFGVDREEGSVGEAALMRYLLGHAVTAEYKWWWSLHSLAGYIAHQIDEGRPVWIGLPHVQHAVVVVGYSNDAVFVHDPSGILLKYALGDDASMDPKRLGRRAIGWRSWDAIAAGRTAWLRQHVGNTEWSQWGLSELFPNQTLVITAGAASGRSLALHLKPGRASLQIEHRRDLHAPKAKLGSVLFQWDGRAEDGWTFDHDLIGIGADADHQRALCNSDVVRRLKVFVSNTGSRPTRATLTALLDGAPIGTATANLPVGTLQPVEIDLDGPLVDVKTPLALGMHTFDVTLDGAEPQDSAQLRFTVLPGMIPGVKVTQAGRKVKVSWAPALEEPTTPSLVYRVYRSRSAASAQRDLVAELPHGTRAYELEVPEGEPPGKMRYSVWAFDPSTKLESMDAAYLLAAEEEPTRPPEPTDIRIVDPVDVPNPTACGILGMPASGCE